MESIEMQQPNAIIFRLPDDEDGEKMFAEVIIENGKLSEQVQPFNVDEDDSLNDLEFCTLVLAVKEDEDTSMEIAAFDITDQTTGLETEVWMIMGELDNILPGLVEAYNNGAGQSLQ